MATKRRRVRARPTPSGRALDSILLEDGPVAKAIRAEIDRSMLWRYCKGRSTPNGDTIAKLATLSGNRIDPGGWSHDAPRLSATGTDG